MKRKTRLALFIVVDLAVVAIIAFDYLTPYNRTPGVRLGGTLSAPPADWSRP